MLRSDSPGETAISLPTRLFERVHAPIGLDIGAVTPEEIAISITAELIGKRRRVERELPHMSWFHSHKLCEAELNERAQSSEETSLPRARGEER